MDWKAAGLSIMELIVALVSRGVPLDEVPEAIGAAVDGAFNFAVLVPGPAGAALEAVDGPIVTALARVIIALNRRRIQRRAKEATDGG